MEAKIISVEDVRKLGITRITHTIKGTIWAKCGARQVEFSGIDPQAEAMLTPHKPVAATAALPTAAPKPEPKPVVAPPQAVPAIIETPNVLDVNNWSDEQIYETFKREIAGVISMHGSLKAALEAAMAHKPGYKPFSDMRDKANKFWHARGQAAYVRAVTEAGIRCDMNADGLATHDYVGTWQAMTGLNWKTKKPIVRKPETISEKAREAYDKMVAAGESPVSKAYKLYRSSLEYQELRKLLPPQDIQALDSMISETK